MDLFFAFAAFMAAMFASLLSGISMVLPLALGLAAFTLVALRQGFAPGRVAGMCLRGMRGSWSWCWSCCSSAA